MGASSFVTVVGRGSLGKHRETFHSMQIARTTWLRYTLEAQTALLRSGDSRCMRARPNSPDGQHCQNHLAQAPSTANVHGVSVTEGPALGSGRATLVPEKTDLAFVLVLYVLASATLRHLCNPFNIV